MNFSSMEYFIAIAEERSFTRAAARLMVTQQTLSAHIAGIERELGVKLINRTVPLSLTFAGETFLGYAQRFQAEFRALRQEFADIAGDERGQLAVAIGSTRGRILLPKVIARFREIHPGVDVRIDEGDNDEIVEWLRTGQTDMAVATVPASMRDIERRPLRSEQVVLLVSKRLLRDTYGDAGVRRAEQAYLTHDLSLLAECPLLMLGRHDQEGDISRRLVGQAGISAGAVVISENSETLVELAVRGVGACLVERGIVRSMLTDEQLERMCVVDLGPDAAIDLQVAWRKSGHVWSIVESFADLLVEQVQRELEGERA